MRLIDANAKIAQWRAAMLHMVKEDDGRHSISMETLIKDLEKSPTIEAEPVKPWISVNDTLPEEYTDVLMYFSCTNMAVGYMEKDGEGSINWCAYSDDGYYDDCNRAPIYWRELPNGPNCGAKMDLKVDNAPTIEAEPVNRGRWLYVSRIGRYAEYECSECKTHVQFDERIDGSIPPFKCCPCCFAKMDLEEKKDDV